MIKIKKKKNPYLSKYGYHFTNSFRLDNILNKGLLVNYNRGGFIAGLDAADADAVERRLAEVWMIDQISKYKFDSNKNYLDYFLFEFKTPLFFTDLPDINRFNTESMQDYADRYFDLILKIDVSEYNQYPDYHMLLIDYDCKIHYDNSFYFLIDIYTRLYQKLSKVLNNYPVIFRNFKAIPFEDLKTNENLQLEIISYTNCFCIDQDIPPEKIIDISYI